MRETNAINIISGLLNKDQISEDTSGLIAKLAHKYPFFLPLKYIKAAQQYEQGGLSNELLGDIYPYTGNWILLNDFLSPSSPTLNGSSNYIENERFTTEIVTTQEPTETKADEPENDIKTFNNAAVLHDEEITEAEEIIEPEEIIEIEETVEPTNEVLTELIAGVSPEEPTDIEADVIEDVSPNFNNEPLDELKIIAPVQQPVVIPMVEQSLEPSFSPASSEDYFMQQGLKIPAEAPADITAFNKKEKSLMIVMSFTEWLLHFKKSSAQEKADTDGQKAIKTMWQKEKLAAAIQEENEEIPENVFEMAVNSITSEEGLASESLAEIYIMQHKYDKAIEMYRKLSLRNPQKNTYFAQKIKEISKEKGL
ncbi:MAG: hypothetical protein H7257_02955 [Taibaiella sp.]|nr:hypothetical protein [Taibaiella sp.]